MKRLRILGVIYAMLLVPAIAFGADQKGPDQNKEPEITEKNKPSKKRKLDDISSNHVDPEKEKTKKLVAVAQKKLEEMRQKHRKISEQVGLIEEKPEQPDKNICCICRESLEKFPKILVHNATDSTKSKEIPHEFHVHCLVDWMQKSCHQPYLFKGVGPEDYESDTDTSEDDDSESEEEISENKLGENNALDHTQKKVPCTICHKDFLVDFGELREKYIEYFTKLSLEKKFWMLDELPIKFASDVLDNYNKLTKKEQLDICSPTECDIILQKFIIKKIDTWDNKTNKENGVWAGSKRLDKDNTDLIKIALNMLENRPITLEFTRLLLLSGYIQDKKKFKKYFDRALKANALLMPCGAFSGVKERELVDFDILVKYSIPTNIDPETLETRKNRARVRLADSCFGKFTQQEQIQLFNKLNMQTGPNMDRKRYLYSKLFQRLSKDTQLSQFDEYYPQLNAKGKTAVLTNIMNELELKKGRPFVVKTLHDLYGSYFDCPEKFIKRIKRFLTEFQTYLGVDDPTIITTNVLFTGKMLKAGELLGATYLIAETTNQSECFILLLRFFHLIEQPHAALVKKFEYLLRGCLKTNKETFKTLYLYIQRNIAPINKSSAHERDQLRILLFKTITNNLKNKLDADLMHYLFMANADQMETQTFMQWFIRQYNFCTTLKTSYLLHYFICPPSFSPNRDNTVRITLQGALPENYFTGLKQKDENARLTVFKELWPKLPQRQRYPALLFGLAYLNPDQHKEMLKAAPLSSWLGACTLQEKIGCLSALCKAHTNNIDQIAKDVCACTPNNGDKQMLLLVTKDIKDAYEKKILHTYMPMITTLPAKTGPNLKNKK